ncbi:carboxypeptidase-like regulatory domain-containing protein [Legionella sp. km772]|uniref:carboxypeptidase-like regulatory domain-containing protein n=1 Tax=Legionella sp. km772 TaxID=2498111 RepID=UPI000F8DBD64|nr:carboxypeptidase-like regulatory domain-containing protein [Legionella sp. km772]RUR05551.1 carboxypeptidase regulatory-like domain-containing protein [Legionella sp. km772]
MKEGYTLVSGFARSFISGEPISGATISSLENDNLKLITDSKGQFGPFEWPIGQELTLVCEKSGSFWSGYKTTQTPTFLVPPEGINNSDRLKNISFQVPSNMAYKLLSVAMGISEDPDCCQIAATITPPNKTMDDIPQGVEGVKAILSPQVKSPAFYFGMFPVVHKTNPFIRGLKTTSLDGGVAFTNVPPGTYTLTAEKDATSFSTITIKARKGVVVNASPPNGPTMIEERSQLVTSQHYQFFKPAAAVAASICIAGLALHHYMK